HVTGLVPHELVRPPELALRHALLVEDHGVVERHALHEPALAQRFRILQETERARAGQLRRELLARHLPRTELATDQRMRELDRRRDLILLIGNRDVGRTRRTLRADRLLQLEYARRHALLLYACTAQHVEERS